MQTQRIFIIFSRVFLLFLNCFCGAYASEGRANALSGGDANLRDADLTMGLTDNEMESALSDLSLSDLALLSQVIDKAKYENELAGRSFLNSNFREPIDYNIKFQNGEVGNEANSDAGDESEQEEEDLAELQKPVESVNRDEPRTRRGRIYVQGIAVDEEYLKQLENSFPRDQDQSEHSIADKKEHIRVKRTD